MENKTVLPVEGNADDQALMLRAFRKAGVLNELVIARDGAEALDYPFWAGKYAGPEVTDCPALMVLDLKLPNIDGMEVLRGLWADERNNLTPVVVLTSSRKEQIGGGQGVRGLRARQ